MNARSMDPQSASSMSPTSLQSTGVQPFLDWAPDDLARLIKCGAESSGHWKTNWVCCCNSLEPAAPQYDPRQHEADFLLQFVQDHIAQHSHDHWLVWGSLGGAAY